MYLTLPIKLQTKVNGELKPGESVLWSGQPNPNRRMLTGFAMWLFFIPWTAFAVFWVAMAGSLQLLNGTSKGIFDFFPLFGIPFVLIGLGGLMSPLWMRMNAARTAYAITNHRIITISGIFSTKYRSYYPPQIQFVERKERRDGSGDLIFSRETTRDSEGSNQTKEEGIYAVPNVKNAELHLSKLLQNTNPAMRETSDYRGSQFR